jgi:glycosyltransferase involved in cell wall biosynthesis
MSLCLRNGGLSKCASVPSESKEENVTGTRKQVLHLTPLAALGGCEVNCLRIIQALDNSDHRVLVFGGQGPMSPAWEAAGARVQHLDSWEHGFGRFTVALASWGKTQDPPDAVIYWSTSRVATVLRTLGHWDTRWAVYLGNPLPEGPVSRIRRRFDEWIQAARPNVTMVACSNHVAASHRGASYFRRFATEVIYNAVDPEFDREHVYRPLGAGSAPTIGMVARLDKIKDHRTLMRAVAAVAPVCPDIVLEFAGDGPLRGDLENEARRLGIGDRVRFLGFKAVAPLLAKWDIYAHSTTESEGMGTAVAEAMLSGLPCLVSDLDVMREVCGTEGAVFAPAGNADGFSQGLLRLIQDRALRETLGGAAKARARRLFGSAQIGSAYARLVFPVAPTVALGPRRV